MKKVILSLIAIASIGTANAGIKIFGIEIGYKRGIREWNADKTDTKCVGRGMCELTIKGEVKAALGVSDDGAPIIIFNDDILDQYPDEFKDGKYPVSDLSFSTTQAKSIGLDHLDVKAGVYPVKKDEKSGRYYVVLR